MVTLKQINQAGQASTYDERDKTRKNGEYEPLQLMKDNVRLHGFLSDWSGDCRLRFLGALQRLGFKTEFYNAPYHWKISNGQYRIEYVEGDIYVSDADVPHS